MPRDANSDLNEIRCMTALRQIIDDKFDQLTDDIADAKEKAEQLRDCLGAMKGAIVAL